MSKPHTEPNRSAGAVFQAPDLHAQGGMFAFYSNRVGCIGSILISLIGSLIVIVVLWLLNAGTG